MSDPVLSTKELHKAIAGRDILAGVSFGLHAGQKVGLIGRNGAGKSTLLRLLAAQEQPDAGKVIRRRDARLHYLQQEPRFAESIVGEALHAAFADLAATIGEYERAAAESSERAADLLHAIEQRGGFAYEHRIEKIWGELGLPPADAAIEHLSGGEAKRLGLAVQLLRNPDVLLLDEPTNHLDTATTQWLEDWLQNTSAAVLVVTHDRYFLDRVCDTMLDLRDGKIYTYDGNYTDYVAERALEEAQRERLRHKRLRHLMNELEWARRAPKARTTKSNARLERIAKVQEEVQQLSGNAFQADFSFGKPPRLGSTIVELHDVGMWFDNAVPLIQGLTLDLHRGERLGIVGRNGAGKSTLLKLIAGNYRPRQGSIVLGKNTRVAHFDQQRTMLKDDATLRDTLTPQGGDHVFPAGKPVHVASWLDRFGFDAQTHRRVVGSLSGGERNRLALALLFLQDANVLLLDEPTNDLDIPTLNVLEESLVSFSGCVLVVSHDRYFLDKIATGILAFDGESGTTTHIQGNYSDYRRFQEQHVQAPPPRISTAAKKQEKPSRAADKSKKKPLTYGEEIELSELEPQIEQVDAQVQALEKTLADPNIWATKPEDALQLQDTLQAAQQRQQTLFSRWEALMLKKEGGD